MLPVQLSSSSVFSDLRVARSFVFCVVFSKLLFALLVIVLSVFLRLTTFDWPFKLFLSIDQINIILLIEKVQIRKNNMA
jgi:hypothetical protein